MRRTLALGLAGVVLVFAAAAHATIRPQYGMSGVSLGMTKTQVRARLGRPIGSGGARFYYARVWVGFRLGRVVEVTTTRSTERTASGVGVDSSESDLRRAYPSVVCGAFGGFRVSAGILTAGPAPSKRYSYCAPKTERVSGSDFEPAAH